MRPDFLPVPARTAKPRSVGLTHVLDKGAAPDDVRRLVDRASHLIDIWKLGWGTAYLEPDVGEKVAMLQRAGVRACVGGTLLEAAWAAGAAERCLAWAADVGFSCVEVSNGAVAMPLWEKRRLVSLATRGFLVIAEVGSKSPTAEVSPQRPVRHPHPRGAGNLPWPLGGIYRARSAASMGTLPVFAMRRTASLGSLTTFPSCNANHIRQVPFLRSTRAELPCLLLASLRSRGLRRVGPCRAGGCGFSRELVHPAQKLV
jgi:hypothetical protein